MNIAERIREQRLQMELTQEDLAGRLYVTRQTVANWERGRTQPDIQSLKLMAALFNMSVDKLIADDEDSPEVLYHRMSPERREATDLVLFSLSTETILLIMILIDCAHTFIGLSMKWQYLISDLLIITCLIVGNTYIDRRLQRLGLKKLRNYKDHAEAMAYAMGYKSLDQVPKRGKQALLVRHWYKLYKMAYAAIALVLALGGFFAGVHIDW